MPAAGKRFLLELVVTVATVIVRAIARLAHDLSRYENLGDVIVKHETARLRVMPDKPDSGS